jgi:hypothetical protein
VHPSLSRARVYSLLSTLSSQAKLPVLALTLTEEIVLLNARGEIQKCCCDPAICACYVCIEQMPERDPFSVVTAAVALSVMGALGGVCLC